ncbi:MAG: lysophospholipid acyltransferase family protein [Methylotenera sp.]|nr:lysophospholipid acyltransferase family protein [Methylotenera sp.]
MPAFKLIPLKTNRITRYFRISRIITHTLSGLLIASVLFPFTSQAFKARLIKWWCRKLLVAFNLRVVSFGHIPGNVTSLSNTMFVANHISWSDIHALNGLIPLRFIAKSEIKNWPIFGYLVSKANTLFIDRNKRQDAKRTIDIAQKSLQAGDNLCFFPEGTTTDGTEIRPFKSSLIQAGILAGATVWPVAIRYPNADGSINTQVAYAGETTLAESMQQILLQKQPIVELHFLTPISPVEYANMDRRGLTLHIEGLIRHKLDL